MKKDDIAGLRARLQEAEDTLEAIRQGAVDAVVVKEDNAQEIYTLRSADHTYRVLIESMNQGALTLATDGTILYSNNWVSQLTGQPLEQIIGTHYADLFTPADRPMLKRLVTDGATAQDVELCLPGDPSTVVVVSAARLPRAKDEAYMGVVITDITDRKRMELAKDEFISLASHQLRTPATGVKQYLGMLLEGYAGQLEDGQREFVQTAYRNNETQLEIISNILRTAQVDSGLYTLKKVPCNLSALVDQVVTNFQALLLMRQQTITCDINAALQVDVDAADFSLALTNLIENASKYSPVGKTITISAAQTQAATTISIADQGVGIGPDDQSKIFEKFTRVNNELSDTVTGSGLGLYWVKRVIGLHGGDITVASVVGQGATFTIRLPR